MTDRNSLAQEVGAALRDHGITAAITALIGGRTTRISTCRAGTSPTQLAALVTNGGFRVCRFSLRRA